MTNIKQTNDYLKVAEIVLEEGRNLIIIIFIFISNISNKNM